jgi:hypothetical protein
MFAKRSNRGLKFCGQVLIALIGLSALWSGNSAAQSAEGAAAPAVREIEYAYPNPSVWTSRLNSRGEPENPLLNLAGALFLKAGIPWHGANYPAARVFENLRNGTSTFSMLVNSPSVQDCCVVSKKPITNTELRIYRLANQPPVTTRDELAGKNIITVLGYSYGGLLPFLEDRKNNISNNVVSTHEAAFAMLERGRADYLIDYVGPSTEILAAHPIPDIKSELFQRIDVYLVLSKKQADAPRLMARLEAAVNGLNGKDLPQGRARSNALPDAPRK